MDWLMKTLGLTKDEPQPEPERTPEPEPEIDPYTAEYDDWEQHHGDWHQTVVCHCGYQMPVLNGMSLAPAGRVCPKCGHTDKWKSKIVRYEWEDSFKKFMAIFKYRSTFYTGEYDQFYTGEYDHLFVKSESIRNKRLVEWTEDHCKVNEDSSQ